MAKKSSDDRLERAGDRVVRALQLLDEANGLLDGGEYEFPRGILYAAHVALCSTVDIEERKPTARRKRTRARKGVAHRHR